MKTAGKPHELFEDGSFWDWCDTLSLPAALIVILAMIGTILLL